MAFHKRIPIILYHLSCPSYQILNSSLFTFFTDQGKTGKNEHMEMKILQPIFCILVVLMKIKKIYNELGIRY